MITTETPPAVSSMRLLGGGEWQPISTAPKDSTVIDVWSASEGRCTNYKRVKLSGDNIFYDPDQDGICCLRDVTHWMRIPDPPNARTELPARITPVAHNNPKL